RNGLPPDLGELEAAVMQDIRHGNGVRTAFVHDVDQVLHRAHPAARDDRYRHGLRDGPNELAIEALARSFAVHRRDENLAGAALDALDRPFDDFAARPFAAVVDVRFPAASVLPLRLDREDHRLAAEAAGNLRDQVRPFDRGGIDGDFVRARAQQPVDVVDAANAAADRQRHEDVVRGAADDLEQVVAPVEARDDVHVDELVDSLLVVPAGVCLRIADDAQPLEMNALDEI